MVGAGEIAQQGKPKDVYDKPNSTFVATFVGSPKMNLLDGVVASGVFSTKSGLSLPLKGVAAGAVTLGVRPDDLILEVVDRRNAPPVQIDKSKGLR